MPFKSLPQTVKDYVYFPKGSWWIYSYKDKNANHIDTILCLESRIDTVHVNGHFWHYDYEAITIIYSTQNSFKDNAGIWRRPVFSYKMTANGGDIQSHADYSIEFECYRSNPSGYQSAIFFFPFDTTYRTGDYYTTGELRYLKDTNFINNFGLSFMNTLVFFNSREDIIRPEDNFGEPTIRYYEKDIGLVRWQTQDKITQWELMSYYINK